MPKYIIKDWADNHLFQEEVFESFEDAWEYIYDNIDSSEYDESGNEDDNPYQDLFVSQT